MDLNLVNGFRFIQKTKIPVASAKIVSHSFCIRFRTLISAFFATIAANSAGGSWFIAFNNIRINRIEYLFHEKNDAITNFKDLFKYRPTIPNEFHIKEHKFKQIKFHRMFLWSEILKWDGISPFKSSEIERKSNQLFIFCQLNVRMDKNTAIESKFKLNSKIKWISAICFIYFRMRGIQSMQPLNRIPKYTNQFDLLKIKYNRWYCIETVRV